MRAASVAKILSRRTFNCSPVDNMEHRCGSRYLVDVPVVVRSHGSSVSVIGWLADVSISGGLVHTITVPPLLSSVKLEFLDGDEMGTPIHGHVARRTAQSVGIEWFEFAPELVRRLTDPTTPLAVARALNLVLP
jgi:hypothetical protein